MKSFGQTIARIGFGFAAMSMLMWLMWPMDVAAYIEKFEPEPFFCVWGRVVCLDFCRV